MKSKMDSESDGPENGEYGERRGRMRKKQNIGMRSSDQNGKISTYSSSSRLTSMLKAHSIS